MRATLLLFASLSIGPSVALAQAPPPMPAEIHASIGVSGPARDVAVVHVTFGADWAIDGCLGSGRCTRTRRVLLTAAQRVELVQLWMAVTSMPRCEPAAFTPGDPEFSVDTPGLSLRGHLPAAPSDLAARTSGACAADARLAWWLAQRMGA